MSDELKSLSTLFHDRLFRIPDYQRGYAWKNEHLVDFWDDLINLKEGKSHYTGLLSLKLVTDKSKIAQDDAWLIETGQRKVWHVVDGQQRLTTISILLFELLRLVRTFPENENKDERDIFLDGKPWDRIRDDFISIQRRDRQELTYLFDYESGNPSEKYLRYKIFEEEGGPQCPENYYTVNLREAKQFFRENLQDYLNRKGPGEISKLYRKITTRLMFNIHEIKDDYDVLVAFETMNNRGKKLTDLECLKNRLIYLTTLFGDDAVYLRDDINNAWKEVYIQLGRNGDAPLSDDEYLSCHWINFFKYSTKRGENCHNFLFDKKFSPKNIMEEKAIVDETIDARGESSLDFDPADEDEGDTNPAGNDDPGNHLTPTDIETYVKSLETTAQHWFYSYFPYGQGSSLTPEEKKWIGKLNNIGFSYFRPLVVASLALGDHVSPDERVELFKGVERFIFLVFRMAMIRTNYKTNVFHGLAGNLFKKETTIQHVIDELNNATDAESASAVTAFVSKTQDRFKSGDGFFSWQSLGYFLYEYELEFAEQKKISKVAWEDVAKGRKESIEHIFPQNPNPNEGYWSERFGHYTEKEKKWLLGSLGNLLLLDRDFNASFSNHPFPQKKSGEGQMNNRGYRNGSHSEIEVAATYDDWTKESILQRGRHLLSFLSSRWNISLTAEQTDALLGISLFEQ